MNSRKIKVLMIVLLVSAMAAACGSENTFDQQVAVAVVVGLTETAVALQQPSATLALQLASPEATIAAAGTVVSSSGYQPLSADECNNLQCCPCPELWGRLGYSRLCAVHGLYQSEERHGLFDELLADFGRRGKWNGQRGHIRPAKSGLGRE